MGEYMIINFFKIIKYIGNKILCRKKRIKGEVVINWLRIIFGDV